jgi:signal transduction histidine kinase
VPAIVLGLVFWLLMASIAGLLLWRERQQALESARQSADALVQVMEAHTARTFQTVDLVLAGVADTLKLSDLPRHDRRFRETLSRRLEEIPYVRAIFVIGPDGHFLHDTDYPRTPDVPLDDRDYFIKHRDHPDLVRSVSAPVQSRSAHGRFLAATRRIGGGDRFEGIIVAAVQPDYFQSLYQSLKLTPGRAIGLYHTNGQVVVRYPPAGSKTGSSIADSTLFENHLPTETRGTYLAAPDAAQRRRMVSFGKLDRLPLVVTIAQDTRDILASWRTVRAATFVGLVSLLLLVVACLVLFIRHQALQEGARQRQAQREKLESLGRLTGGTAHDFANLLAVVSANLEILGRIHSSDPRAANAVAVGKRAVSSGRTLIDQMLAFAKDRALRIEPVDANALITSRADLLRHAAGSRIAMHFDLAADLPTCQADATQLEVALVNLVVNARDAMPSGGAVSIRTDACPDPDDVGMEGHRPRGAAPRQFVRVTVRDDGPGMPADVRDHLFEPFFTTKGDAGHGFGLSQVYGFMRQVGGDVRVETAPGEGTSICLYFPAVPAAPAVQAGTMPPHTHGAAT